MSEICWSKLSTVSSAAIQDYNLVHYELTIWAPAILTKAVVC